MQKEKVFKNLGTVSGIALSIFLISYVVFAWQEPASPPPGGNVNPPLHQGDANQTKTGGLNVMGNVGIGTTNPLSLLYLQKTVDDTPLTLRRFAAGGVGKYTGLRFSVADTSVTTDNYHKAGIFFVDDGSGSAKGDFYFSLDAVANDGNVAISDAKMVIKNNGNVGIGTTSPTLGKLQVHTTTAAQQNMIAMQGISGAGGIENLILRYNRDIISSVPADVWQIRSGGAAARSVAFTFTDGTVGLFLKSDGNVGIGTTTPSTELHVNGTITESSDISLKENISDLRYGIGDVMRIKPREFDIKKTGNREIGFIAQELEDIIPEVVKGEEGEKAISYTKLSAVLVKAIQEQENKIREYEERFKEQERRIEYLEKNLQ